MSGGRIGGVTRRGFLLGAGAACAAAPGRAVAQHFTSERLGARNTDYAAYAMPGPYPYPDKPVIFTMPDAGPDKQPMRVALYLSRGVSAPKVLCFSHGSLAEPVVYHHLLNHWASHGYMVLAPVHDDSVIAEGLRIRHQDARGATVWDLSALLNDFKVWQDRCRSCSRTLDYVPDIARTVGIAPDADRPVIAGHSYGAFAAQLLLGATVNTPDGAKSLADPRWAAGILFSPQGAGIMGLGEGSWSAVDKPILALTGGNDLDSSGQDAQRKSDVFYRSQAGYKHLGFMPYGDHTTYSGQASRPGTYEQRLFEDLLSATTCFLRAYIEYDQKAWGHLADDYFDRLTAEEPSANGKRPRHARLSLQMR